MSALQDAIAAFQSLIGKEVGVSDWMTVDQAMIDAFARTTHDQQWIHVDPERAAKETPFGGAIAHGFLTLSLASLFADDCLKTLPAPVMGLNYGINKLRFLAPVRAGSRIRGRFTLIGAKARDATGMLRTHALTIETEGEPTPALVAEWLGLDIYAD